MKKLNEISWQVSEPVYRKDHALSYSTIAKYEREGFESLFGPPLKTSSLTFGSVVDTIMTDGMDAFMERYNVVPLKATPAIQSILMRLAKLNFENELQLINKDDILEAVKECHYGGSWKPQTIINKIVTADSRNDYHNLVLAYSEFPNKEVISEEVYNDAVATVTALKNSPETYEYFKEDDMFCEHYYQLKFKGTIDGVDYRCMADLIMVNPIKKEIIPCDLKTTGKPEAMFWNSFHHWYYFYQAQLYWNLIRMNLNNDEYFKDFKLLPYRFIVVNKTSRTPMVYTFDETDIGEYSYNGVTYRSVSVVGQELRMLLNEREKKMNKEKALEALDTINKGVAAFKEAISETVEAPAVVSTNLKTLAKAVASCYKTNRANLGTDKLFANIKEMANGDKFKILLNWLDASTIEAIKVFRMQPLQDQQLQLQEAISLYSDDIKEILKRKYAE